MAEARLPLGAWGWGWRGVGERGNEAWSGVGWWRSGYEAWLGVGGEGMSHGTGGSQGMRHG